MSLALHGLAGWVAVLWLGWLGVAWAESPPARDVMSTLPQMKLTPAPEFPSTAEWVNTDRPLSLRALRGKLVLLDFWTYGCINCLHILPDLHRLETTYQRELVVIGVHTAKYGNEAVTANLIQAIRRYGIQHAVINDHDSAVWKAYRVSGWPTQILIDPTGHILQGFIGEYHDKRLDRLIAATIKLHRQRGTLRDSAPLPARSAQSEPDTPLRYPGKILVDPASSRLWVADTQHHRIVMAALDGTVQAIIGRGDGGAADGDFARAAFNQPQGLALQGSHLYVADTGNHLVRRVDLDRQMVETLAGTGVRAREFNVPGYGRAVPLNSPWDLHLQAYTLYIAMAGMHQLWQLDLTTTYAEPFAGTGREELTDDVHTDAAFGQPSGISGNGLTLYVADTEVNALREVDLDPHGWATTLAGGGLFTFGDRDGISREARLQHPVGIAAAEDAVYVADTYNHKIKRFDLVTDRLQTIAGTDAAGWRDGAAAQAQFYEPSGLSLGSGQLYIADTNNHRVRVLDLKTGMVKTLPLRGLTPPVAGAEAPSDSQDLTEVMRLGEQSLPASAKASMRIELHAPDGWQVNARAPGLLAVIAQGAGVEVPDTYAKKTVRPMPAELEVPLQMAEAGTAALVRIDLTFVLCRKGNQAVCVPRQVAWEVPVRSRPGVSQTELRLQDRMASIAREFAN